MTEELYRRSLAWFRADVRRERAAVLCMRGLTGLFAASYGVLVVVLLILKEGSLLWRCFLVPAVGFAVVSVFRHLLDRPRPCEVYHIEPLQERNVPGRSFPSRHTFSGVLIAMVFLRVFPPLGVVFLLLAAVLGTLRILSGLHFIRDVIAGAAAAFAIGLFGLFWL